jgi:hypothetical protein
MKMRGRTFVLAALTAAVALAAVGAIAIADPAEDSKAGGQPEFKLPAGWTEADMQACILAPPPGKMEERWAQVIGVWGGKYTMWLGPGAVPIETECTNTITPLMDGRFTKCEMVGEMPGMGPYHGFAIFGFDNVSQEFVSTWIDNHGTGMANGVGELSSDGKTLTWDFTYNCPVTKKPVVMRQVETTTGPGRKTLEMFGADPKRGQEYKMMRI